jgi:hypothetical protein
MKNIWSLVRSPEFDLCSDAVQIFPCIASKPYCPTEELQTVDCSVSEL